MESFSVYRDSQTLGPEQMDNEPNALVIDFSDDFSDLPLNQPVQNGLGPDSDDLWDGNLLGGIDASVTSSLSHMLRSAMKADKVSHHETNLQGITMDTVNSFSTTTSPALTATNKRLKMETRRQPRSTPGPFTDSFDYIATGIVPQSLEPELTPTYLKYFETRAVFNSHYDTYIDHVVPMKIDFPDDPSDPFFVLKSKGDARDSSLQKEHDRSGHTTLTGAARGCPKCCSSLSTQRMAMRILQLLVETHPDVSLVSDHLYIAQMRGEERASELVLVHKAILDMTRSPIHSIPTAPLLPQDDHSVYPKLTDALNHLHLDANEQGCVPISSDQYNHAVNRLYKRANQIVSPLHLAKTYALLDHRAIITPTDNSAINISDWVDLLISQSDAWLPSGEARPLWQRGDLQAFLRQQMRIPEIARGSYQSAVSEDVAMRSEVRQSVQQTRDHGAGLDQSSYQVAQKVSTNEVQVATIEHSQNITFAEQNQSSVMPSPYSDQSILAFHSKSAMLEHPWTMAAMLDRPLLITRVQWSPNQPSGTTIWRGKIPGLLFNNTDNAVKQFASLFTMWNFDIEFKFQIIANQFCSGMIRAWINPLDVRPANLTDRAMNGGVDLFNTHLMDNVEIWANDNAPRILPYKYFSSRPYVPLTNDVFDGQIEDPQKMLLSSIGGLYLDVHFPLSNATTSPATILIYAKITNKQFHGPVQTHDIYPDSYQDEGTSLPRGAYQASTPAPMPAGAGGNANLANDGFALTVSNMAAKPATSKSVLTEAVSNATDCVESLWHGDWSGWVKNGLKTAANVLPFILHKATIPGRRLKHHGLGSYVNTMGVQEYDRIGDFSKSWVEHPDEFIQKSVIHYSIHNLARLPGVIQLLTLSTSNSTGSKVASGLLSPHILYKCGPAANNFQVYSEPPCSFIARKFARWRGSLVYTFRISATQFHTGQLVFEWHYGVAPDALQTEDERNRFYMRIGTENRYEIVVPVGAYSTFLRTPPWRRRYVQGESVVPQSNYNIDEAFGSWAIFINQAIGVNSPAISSTIHMDISVRFHDDAEFSTYTGDMDPPFEEGTTFSYKATDIGGQPHSNVVAPIPPPNLLRGPYQAKYEPSSSALTGLPEDGHNLGVDGLSKLTPRGDQYHANVSEFITDYMHLPKHIGSIRFPSFDQWSGMTEEINNAACAFIPLHPLLGLDPKIDRVTSVTATTYSPNAFIPLQPIQSSRNSGFPTGNVAWQTLFAGGRGSMRLRIQPFTNICADYSIHVTHLTEWDDISRIINRRYKPDSDTGTTDNPYYPWFGSRYSITNEMGLPIKTRWPHYNKPTEVYALTRETGGIPIEIPATQLADFQRTNRPLYGSDGILLQTKGTMIGDQDVFNGALFITIEQRDTNSSKTSAPATFDFYIEYGDDWAPIRFLGPPAWSLPTGSTSIIRPGLAFAPTLQRGEYQALTVDAGYSRAFDRYESMSVTSNESSGSRDAATGPNDPPIHVINPTRIPMRQAYQQLKQVPNDILTATANMNQQLCAATTQFETVMKPMEATFKNANQITDKISKFLGIGDQQSREQTATKLSALAVGQMSGHILDVIAFVRAEDWTGRILAIVRGLIAAGVTWLSFEEFSRLLKPVITPIQSTTDDEFFYNQASGDEKPTYLPTKQTQQILTSIAALAATGKPNIRNQSVMDKISNHFRYFATVNSGINGIIGLYEKIIQVIKWIVKLILGDEVKIPFCSALEKHQKEFEKYIREAYALSDETVLIDAQFSETTRFQILRLFDETTYLSTIIEKVPNTEGGEMKTLFNDARQKVLKIHNTIKRMQMTVATREEPFCLWLHGDPGKGKTVAAQYLARVLATECGVPGASGIYNKDAGEAYWSNYNHQPVVIMDDLSQQVTPQGDDLITQFMILKSCNGKILPMADVSEKGRSFTSKAIVVTDNFAFPDVSLFVREPNAFYRRRDVMARVTSTVDMHQMVPGDHSHLRFQLCNPQSTGIFGEPMEWEDFVRFVRAKFTCHMDKQATIKSSIQLSETVQLDQLTAEDYQHFGLAVPTRPLSSEPLHSSWHDLPAEYPYVVMAQRGNPDAALAGVRAYEHWGVRIAEDQIVHVEFSMTGKPNQSRLRVTSRYAFAQSSRVAHKPICEQVITLREQLGKPPIATTFQQRLQSLINTDVTYRIGSHNCEHYANYLVYGIFASFQVHDDVAKYVDGTQIPKLGQFEANVDNMVPYMKFRKDCEAIKLSDFDIYQAIMHLKYRSRIDRFLLKHNLSLQDTILYGKSPNQLIREYCEEHGLEPYSVREHIRINEIPELKAGRVPPESKFQAIFPLPSDEKDRKEVIDWIEHKVGGGISNLPLGQRISVAWDAMITKIKFLWAKLEREHPWVAKSLKVIGILAAIGGVIGVVWGIIGALAPVAFQEQAYSGGATKFRGKTIAQTKIAKLTRAPYQDRLDHNTQNIINQRIKQHLVNITVPRPNNQVTRAHGIVTGKMLIANSHTFFNLPRGTPITITSPYRACEVQFGFDPDDFVWLNSDITACYLVGFDAFKDIKSLCIKEDDTNYLYEHTVSLVVQTPDGQPTIKTGLGRALTDIVGFDPHDDKIPERIIHAFRYTMSTMPGDCGSPLLISNPRCPRKIVGIHSIGKGNEGFCALLTQETIDYLEQELQDPNFHAEEVDDHIPLVMNYQSALELNGLIDEVGGLARPISSPTKTKIEPSPLHGIWPTQTAPAVLSPRDPRNKSGNHPMVSSLSKYTTPQHFVNTGVLKEAVEETAATIIRDYPPVRQLTDLPTIQDCINGLPIDHYEPLAFDTSPGYPYVTMRRPGDVGKAFLFDGEPGERTPKPILQARLDERMRKLQEGKTSQTLWIDLLKDERRPLDRIEQGKTRTFCLGPVDSTILGRRWFMDLIAAMEFRPTSSFSAVGIDPESYDWTLLYNRLKSKSTVGFDVDYSSYDGSLPAEFMDAVATISNKWYAAYYPNHTREDERARRILYDEVIHTNHLVLNTVYQKHRGNPSGFFMTTISNGINGFLLLNYAWRMLCRTPDRAVYLNRFQDCVSVAIYGDDNVVTVVPEVQEWFTLPRVARVLAEIGVTATSADKSDTGGFKKLSDMTFLKRGFRPHPQQQSILLAPIADKTIRELPQWQHIGAPPTQLADNISDTLRFAYHHGRKYYNEIKNDITKFCIEHSLHEYIPINTFSDANDQFLARIFSI